MFTLQSVTKVAQENWGSGHIGAIRPVEEYLKEKELFPNPGGYLNAHLTQHYLAWNRALVECSRLLGIDKRRAIEAIPAIAEVVASIDAEEAARDALEGQTEAVECQEQGDGEETE